MPPLKSGRSRLATGCAVVAMATVVTLLFLKKDDQAHLA